MKKLTFVVAALMSIAAGIIYFFFIYKNQEGVPVSATVGFIPNAVMITIASLHALSALWILGYCVTTPPQKIP